MDVYSLTKKQRPTQLTRGEIDKNTTTNNTMTQPQQSQLPPQYRQALLEQQRQQQQQQQQQQPQANPAPPTLQEIETKHSQLPPQYRQAVLEQQQREHQMRLLQQQQGQPPQQTSPKMDSPRPQSSSLASSPTGSGSTTKRSPSSHQRILSAPHMTNRLRDGDANQGPSRAHWKPDSSTNECTWSGCRCEFGFFDRRHHCRRCGEIFCSAHCSKTIPLDHALDFNPAMGVSSRACIGCFEEYEQWQGLVPTSLALSSSTYANNNNQNTRGAIGSVSESNLPGNYSSDKGNNNRKNTGHIPEGLLGQNGGTLSAETLGREDVVRLPKSTSDNIAIKSRPAQDQTVMPMPSVPHDWSWSTF